MLPHAWTGKIPIFWSYKCQKKQNDVAKELFKKSSVKLLFVFFAYTGYLLKGGSWEPVQLVSFELCDDAYFTVLLFSILAAPICIHPPYKKK